MHMIARIKSNSYIARDWRGRRHDGGILEQLHFHWDGKHFISAELEPDQFARLEHNPYAEMEVIGVATATPLPATPPTPPPPSPPPPPPVPVITDDELFGPSTGKP
jgi:hypothetical protein